MSRQNAVAAARGDRPFDLLIRDAQLVNVFTAEITPCDIGIVGNLIAAVAPANTLSPAEQVIDAGGRYATPGFIDGHVHNESSMCTPAEWARVIVPKGTTTVCTDPHEIGNVLGLPGIRYMLQASEGLPIRYYVTASSCVPAVPSVETAGATIQAAEMAQLLTWERVIAVAEAMDYMGLINQTGNITPIVETGHEFNVAIQGHAPGVVGPHLQAYLAATGPRASDHEAVMPDEMLEKVRAGMLLFARISSYLDVSDALVATLQQVPDSRLFGFCSDDVFPHDLLRHGHLDYGLRHLIAKGIDPVRVIQMATINVANYYGLHGHGAIGPGYLADILLLDNLEEISVTDVIVDGRHVVAAGEWQVALEQPIPPLLDNTVHLPELDENAFWPALNAADGSVEVNAIDMSQLLTNVQQVELEVSDGRVRLPLPEDVCLGSVVPRHGQGTAPSLAFLSGYGLQRGALATTVAHDSHNLVIIGKDPTSMLTAARAIDEMQGGLVAVDGDEVIASLALPIAGLMSPDSVAEITAQLNAYTAKLPELGLPPMFPLTLLVLALPVFPFVRLSDKGMVDVATQQFIPITNG